MFIRDRDNADLRLTELGYKIGLASQERMEKLLVKKKSVEELHKLITSYTVRPETMDPLMVAKETSKLFQPVKAHTILARPQISLLEMMDYDPALKESVEKITNDKYALEQIEIQIKYSGYIQKEFEMVEELSKKETAQIPEKLDYSKIKSLSTEGFQKLSKIRPETIGQASRISGVSASDVAVLMVYLKR